MAEPQPEAPQGSIRPLIFVLGVCGFASTFTMRLVDPIVPTLAAEFSRTIPQIAMIATAFSFSYALGQPFLGPIADSAGKLRTIVACLTLLGLLSVLSSFASSFELLTLARSMTGVVAGGIIPVAMAAIGDRAPVAGRQAALGQFTVLMLAGQMAGAACSGIVADYLGWRAVFFMAAMLALLAALLAQVVLKPRPDAVRRPLSLKGALEGYGVVFSNPRSKLL
ncbi:MAG: MFS transporter, partial [Bosea sp. (in: a-proteobacteria)]